MDSCLTFAKTYLTRTWDIFHKGKWNVWAQTTWVHFLASADCGPVSGAPSFPVCETRVVQHLWAFFFFELRSYRTVQTVCADAPTGALCLCRTRCLCPQDQEKRRDSQPPCSQVLRNLACLETPEPLTSIDRRSKPIPHPRLWMLCREETGVLWYSVLRKGDGQSVFPRVEVEDLGRHMQEWLLCPCRPGTDNSRAGVCSSLSSEYLNPPPPPPRSLPKGQ